MSAMSILEAFFHAIWVGWTGSHEHTPAEVEAKLAKMAAAHPDARDWRNSIVDLMKIAGMDSSLEARKKLAFELGYAGPLSGTAAMNDWLHAQVMKKLSRYP